jgi:uncharacterized protein (DUF58 family)
VGPAVALTPEGVVRRLEWHVIRRLDGRAQGDFRTHFRGAGIDVRDIREYEYGDDVRYIDWNVTARMDAPFVREHTEDRELTAWLLLDRSPSMSFGPIDRPKELVLTEVATTICRLLTRGGNRVGAILYSNVVDAALPARGGRRQALRLARALLQPVIPSGTTTDLSGLLTVASRTIRRRSLVVLISDFISQPGWEAPLGLLSQHHEVVAIRLVDPREFELPDVGIVVVEDAETGEQMHVDTSDPEFRRRLRTAATNRRAIITTAARRAGVDLHEISTDEDLVDSLVRLTATRKARTARMARRTRGR